MPKMFVGVAVVLLAVALVLGWAMTREQTAGEAAAPVKARSVRSTAEPLRVEPSTVAQNTAKPRQAQAAKAPDRPAPAQISTLPVPRSLEQALRDYPASEMYLQRYEKSMSCCVPQWRVRVDDEIRMVVEVEDCVGGRVASGFARTVIKYHQMPGSDSDLWVDYVKVIDSNLSREELELVMACLDSKVMHRRQPIKVEKYKRTPTDEGGFFSNFVFAWPIEYSDVFQFLQTGNWPDLPPTPNN